MVATRMTSQKEPAFELSAVDTGGNGPYYEQEVMTEEETGNSNDQAHMQRLGKKQQFLVRTTR